MRKLWHLLEDVQHPYDVRMMPKGAQEDDLAIGALRIGLIPEGVVDLLQCHGVLITLVRGLPHNAVGTFAQTLRIHSIYIYISISDKR